MNTAKQEAFFILTFALILSSSYSVFELAKNTSEITNKPVLDELFPVLSAFGSVALASFLSACIGIVLLVLNISASYIRMKSEVSAKSIAMILRIPVNIILFVSVFSVSFMIYSEYFFTKPVNPLSGSIITDVITAISAFLLMFVRKF